MHFLIKNVRAGIELSHINKVILLPELEPVPGGPVYLAGLLNLAGKSITVIDLAMCLGMERSHRYTLETPIIICTDEQSYLGIIVDKILGLEAIDPMEIQMKDKLDQPDSPFMGVATIANNLTLLINIKNILERNSLLETIRYSFDPKLMIKTATSYE